MSIPTVMFYDNDILGKIVRDAWIEWAKEQPNPKPSWLIPYEELSQPDKDADIRIGLAVMYACNEAIEKNNSQNNKSIPPKPRNARLTEIKDDMHISLKD